jgi:ADP-ribose pyrophosphatase
MFTTISSETVLEGRVFNVRRDLLEAGGRRFVREVVVHPGAVAVIPVDEDGMLYLVRQYRHAVGGELVEVVAGTLEDESPRECALRELEEEPGFRPRSLLSWRSST